MKELYWITVLGNVSATIIFMIVILCIIGLILIVTYVSGIEDEDKQICIKCRKYGKWTVIAVITLLLLQTFTPTKKEMYLIYGAGGTLDYLKENPTAKKLPDKCIKAIDKWVDSMNEKEETK